ncbi:MAG: chromosome segregation in meiosis- protein [Sclerophora amabilis]|nr:MAG: chromosome segregation in meiosis- protein [Sclerophora amabilis]
MVSADVNPFFESSLDDVDSPHLASRSGAAANPLPGDDIDDLFNYDAGRDEMFRDVDTDMNAPVGNSVINPNTNDVRERSGGDGGLGIDEEIKVKRIKKVHVKLDEEKLLSQAGIPKLRRISKERLRFKGKGHEFSDVTRLLAFYQLWLDDLFPKAKFADALSIIEKLGHSRRLQVMRREWIEEKRPRSHREEDVECRRIDTDQDRVSQIEPRSTVEKRPQNMNDGDSGQDAVARLETPPVHSVERDDLYSGTPIAPRTVTGPEDANNAVQPSATEVPEEDDLDALLAEDAQERSHGQERSALDRDLSAAPVTGQDFTFRDEGDDDLDDDQMEALREMEAMN